MTMEMRCLVICHSMTQLWNKRRHVLWLRLLRTSPLLRLCSWMSILMDEGASDSGISWVASEPTSETI